MFHILNTDLTSCWLVVHTRYTGAKYSYFTSINSDFSGDLLKISRLLPRRQTVLTTRNRRIKCKSENHTSSLHVHNAWQGSLGLLLHCITFTCSQCNIINILYFQIFHFSIPVTVREDFRAVFDESPTYHTEKWTLLCSTSTALWVIIHKACHKLQHCVRQYLSVEFTIFNIASSLSGKTIDYFHF